MPDYTLCTGGMCKDKAVCLRHTAKPSMHQSFFLDVPSSNKNICNYYIPNTKENSNNGKQRTNKHCNL